MLKTLPILLLAPDTACPMYGGHYRAQAIGVSHTAMGLAVGEVQDESDVRIVQEDQVGCLYSWLEAFLGADDTMSLPRDGI
jgi:hypothetical protein